MAVKRTVTKKAAARRRKAKAALKLSRKARVELTKLLRRHRKGTLTHVALEISLVELHEEITRMVHFVRGSI